MSEWQKVGYGVGFRSLMLSRDHWMMTREEDECSKGQLLYQGGHLFFLLPLVSGFALLSTLPHHFLVF